MTNNWGITTSKGQQDGHLDEALLAIGRELEIPLIPRANQGLQKLQARYQLSHLFVLESDGELAVYSGAERLTFHPGMAVPILRQLRLGQQELIGHVLNLTPGDRVLDCTLGLANDAIIASALVESPGAVTGIESSPIIYTITKYGLVHSTTGNNSIQEAMARIKVQLGDYHLLLPTMATDSYELVYFDPMFDHPLERSSGIAGLRSLANYAPLQAEDLAEARRIATKRVVVKYRRKAPMQLPFDRIMGGKYSPIAFGILDCQRGG